MGIGMVSFLRGTTIEPSKYVIIDSTKKLLLKDCLFLIAKRDSPVTNLKILVFISFSSRPTADTMESSGPSPTSLNNFRVVYLITQMVGAAIVILMGSWIGVHLGGLSWTSNPATQFNWHPLLMSIGMIFLYGNCKCCNFL